MTGMNSEAGDKASLTGTRFTFQDVFESLRRALCFEEMLDCLLAVALRELEADDGSLLLLVGEENPELKMLAARGLPEEICKRGYVRREGSPSERVLRERRPLIINGTLETAKPENTELQARQIRSALCVPLLVGGRLLGTLNVNRTREGAAPFDQRALHVAEILASQAAMVIENHRLHEELQQRKQLAALGEAVAGIAHSVKNMLAGVHGSLGLVKMGLQTQNYELIANGTEILSRSIAMVSNLVLDMLDMSKERRPLRERFSVADIVRNVAEIVTHKAALLGVELRFETDGADFELWADRDQMTRALLNLVTNAIEACAEGPSSEDGPWVRVRVRKLPSEECPLSPEERVKATNWALLEVADNGPGIPTEMIPRLWDLFFSTKGSKGTGIGLPAVRKTVSEHGGKIQVDTQVGRGATFTILLPIISPEEQKSECFSAKESRS
ncbi:MAG: ATP-binding protein [Candidatus Sumerlaeaceae bacterium]